MTLGSVQHGTSYRIGLTGNIATGKSTVGRMLQALGAELIDADEVTHAVMAPGGPAYGPVIAAFGTEILDVDGAKDCAVDGPIARATDRPIDRRALGRRVFSDPEALRRLETLVHPAVFVAVERRIAESSARVVVVEAIKLLESGMADSYDAIWVTTCSEATQLQRLMQARGLSREAALERIHAQPPQAEKLARADWVIDTDGTLDQTEAQVHVGWQSSLSLLLSPAR